MIFSTIEDETMRGERASTPFDLPILPLLFLFFLSLLLLISTAEGFLHVTQTRQAGASTTVLDAKAKSPRGTERSFDLLNERDSNIFYLKEELELDDSTMMNIIRKHSYCCILM